MADKTTISLRIPVSLVETLDEEASTRKRSRAFVVIEKLEQHYSNGSKTPAKAAKKAKVTR